MALQEVKHWAKSNNGRRENGYRYYGDEKSDCGILIPENWASAVKKYELGAHVASITFKNNTAFVSAHALDMYHVVREDTRSDVMFQDIERITHSAKEEQKEASSGDRD